MGIPFPREKADMLKQLLRDQRPASRMQAMARGVQGIAGKLWNLTYVVRVGRYFVWRLLRLTASNDSPSSKNENNAVEIGGEFHANLLFWKCVIDHEVLLEREALCTSRDKAKNDPLKSTIYLTPVLTRWAGYV